MWIKCECGESEYEATFIDRHCTGYELRDCKPKFFKKTVHIVCSKCGKVMASGLDVNTVNFNNTPK